MKYAIGFLIPIIIIFAYLNFASPSNPFLNKIPQIQPKPVVNTIHTVIEEPTSTPIPTVVEAKIEGKKQVLGNSTSSIDCVGPDGVIFKTSESECQKLNSAWGKPLDQIVTCSINTNCGGGTKTLKKSECDNSTCCEINGKWYFYTSKDKCSEDQKAYYSDLYKYSPPSPYPTSSYIPLQIPTIYISPSNDVNKQAQIQLCLDRADSNYKNAKSTCLNTARGAGAVSSSWYNNCVQTATNNYDYDRKNCNY